MKDNLLNTWSIHNRINIYLLNAITPEGFQAISASGGRTVGDQFAHMHNVRLRWLEGAAPELRKGLVEIPKEKTPEKPLLQQSFEQSGHAIEELIRQVLPKGGKVKVFKGHAITFIGYLISHESHHRGQIILSLKQAGFTVDKEVLYGIWKMWFSPQ